MIGDGDCGEIGGMKIDRENPASGLPHNRNYMILKTYVENYKNYPVVHSGLVLAAVLVTFLFFLFSSFNEEFVSFRMYTVNDLK
jgi:hypothetical protein